MVKFAIFAVVGIVLLAGGIAAFVVGSTPSLSTASSYLTFSQVNVDVSVDAQHAYHNSIPAQAGDKFVFNLTLSNGRVSLALWLRGNEVFQQNYLDEVESEFLAPSNGVYDFTIDTTESVAVNGTVSVLRSVTTTTTTAFYFGLGLILTVFSFLFIFYSVYLYLETEKKQNSARVD